MEAPQKGAKGGHPQEHDSIAKAHAGFIGHREEEYNS